MSYCDNNYKWLCMMLSLYQDAKRPIVCKQFGEDIDWEGEYVRTKSNCVLKRGRSQDLDRANKFETVKFFKNEK